MNLKTITSVYEKGSHHYKPLPYESFLLYHLPWIIICNFKREKEFAAFRETLGRDWEGQITRPSEFARAYFTPSGSFMCDQAEREIDALFIIDPHLLPEYFKTRFFYQIKDATRH